MGGNHIPSRRSTVGLNCARAAIKIGIALALTLEFILTLVLGVERQTE